VDLGRLDRGRPPGRSYISCIFEAILFINGAIKSATLLAHAVFAGVNSSSSPSEIKNSSVVNKLRNATIHSEP